MKLPLFLALLSLVTNAAAQAPQLEPALTLSGDVAPTEAGGVQHEPYIAAGGAGSLAVWIDHRAEFTSPLGNQGGPDVYAARLDASGQPLDPVAIRMPFEVGDKLYAKAAWNGSSWLVTWENQQPLAFSSFFRLILGARVAADGTVLDTQPIVIKDDLDSTGATTAVASDGDGWVVVVQGTAADPGRIVGVRVAANGSVLNPGGTKLLDFASAIFGPELEYANGTYLLAWGSGTVGGLRFNSTLTPLGGAFTIGNGSSSQPRIATNGTDFLVAWQNQDFGTCIRARRVSAATGAQSSVIQVTPLSNGEYNWQPDVAWSGSTWHVAFRDNDDDVYRDARIAADLTLLDFDGVPLPFGDPAPEGRIVLAGVANGVTAAFERVTFTQPWPGEILCANVDDSLAAAAPVSLSLSATRQGFAAIAAGPAQHLVAFQGEENAMVSIEVQRVDPFGVPLDVEPIELAAGSRLGKPAVAWNGSVYLVVWEDLVVAGFETDDVVFGARVAPDGTVLDPTPFLVVEGSMPAVAAQGDTFLVVSSNAVTTQIRYPFAQRVGGTGALVGAPVQVGGSFTRWPDVAAYKDGWVVAWQRHFSHDSPKSVAEAALVAANGAPGATFGLGGVTGFGGASRPVIASRGDEALFVWQDDSLGLAGRFLNAAGGVGATFQVAALPALPAMPAAAWNGEEYVVAWEDYRELVGLYDYRADVYATRVTPGGAVLDPSGFAIADGDETEIHPAAGGALGSSLIAFVEHLPDAPHATMRVRVRRESPWADAAGGTGSNAVLQGQGELIGGRTATFHLSGAAAAAPGAHVFGLSAIALPFLGGVLVPAPDAFAFFTTRVDGTLATPVPVPPTTPSGLEIHVQAWFLDASVPFGIAGSNAVHSIAP